VKCTYASLKELAYKDESELKRLVLLTDVEAKEIIGELAVSGEVTDEHWCMHILRYLRPQVHDFLSKWTAGRSGEIRAVQEFGGGSEEMMGLIEGFLKNFWLFPQTNKSFIHYSKDNTWHLRLKKGHVFQPRSFMSCAIMGSDFVYAATPRLSFAPSKQSRYLGALTKECSEREVIIPPGAKFEVLDVEGGVVVLSDIDC
jgi:hypothetical protein